jgi:phenylpropionate dioxygenase-like ring-hydroxylating dioxygenase large terminal subunit
MGAYFRFHERSIERKLEAEATSGVVKPPQPPTLGAALAAGADRRTMIPILGLREYWYPALAANRVPKRKPLYWRMLGDEIALFRAADGSIAAVSDICPHRGASLAKGVCVFRGTVSCPYHGATFDAKGDCKAFLGEGPQSQIAEKLHVRSYPTRTLRGFVFIWMGDDEPAPIEEDVPPEFLDDEKAMLFPTYTYWPTNWILAIENQNDSHNCHWAHRNSLMNLTMNRSRSATPIGPRTKLIADRALLPMMKNQEYYKDENGKELFSLYYPGVDGYWPRSWRKIIWAIYKPWYKLVLNPWRMSEERLYKAPEEWAARTGVSAWHLPCQVRVNHGIGVLNRFAVPVSENLSRVIYFYMRRKPRSVLLRLWSRFWFFAWFNWWLHYNFSGQDARITAPCRYWTPENLSSTDSHLIMLRKLITERSRDAKKAQREGRSGRDSAFADDAVLQQQKEHGLGEASLEEAAEVAEAAPVWEMFTKGLR